MEETILPEAAMAAAASGFNNVSAWHNFTIWTAQHLGLAVNMTKLAPSLEDLVWAGPRMVMKLGRLGSFMSIPDAMDNFGQHLVPDATELHDILSSSSSLSSSTTLENLGTFVQSTTSSSIPSVAAAAAAAASSAVQEHPGAAVSRFSMDGARGLGSVFSYATSKWALACIAMAVIINRTHIFAATRRRLRLQWQYRLALRLPILLLLLWQARQLLQSIQCQTSPDFSQLRWNNASRKSELMFTQTDPFLHGLSSALLFGATDKDSCQSIKMVPWSGQEQLDLVGSLSRLWPLFGTFCLSQFIETLSATVQGRPMIAETGMTLFEHSLAFAEADAVISNQLGWGLFANGSKGSTIALTRSMIMNRVNTPPEVLLVAFFSSMGHITSHILGLLNLQGKFRLISTGFWGLCFMASIVRSAWNFSIEDETAQGLLRWPTVCIIGFIPHILILLGMFACGIVYVMALILSALAVPDIGGENERLTFKQRFIRAHGNMQANVPLSDIRIRMDMDFYTALLRAGFGAITMASEAVYLNEDHRVNLKRYTWLEDDRFQEIEAMRMQWIGGGIPGSRFDSIGTIGLVPVKDGQPAVTNGYMREKAAQQIPKKDASGRRVRNGVGAAERSSRWLMAFDYIMHITRLLVVTWALVTVRTIMFIGWRNPPRWLKGLSQRPKSGPKDAKFSRSGRKERGSNADILSPGNGTYFTVPQYDRVDVEGMLRNEIARIDAGANPDADEAEVDSKLYSYFLRGGWWGNNDSSGDFVPPVPHQDREQPELDDPDFDTTSIISTTETSLESEFGGGWETDPDNHHDLLDEGQRTPTQLEPEPNNTFASALNRTSRSRESTPVFDNPFAPADLARLLHPQTAEDREEAMALAAHLSSDRILTRSGFKQQLQRQRAQLLLSGTQHFRQNPRALDKMTPEEEAYRLEQLLLSRRAAGRAKANSGESAITSDADTWATGAAGLGPDGPQCVVCQCAARTIIVWPCRCLSLCDDCRVSLAMNNFDKCVCCRREVISFSRIYVP
ncbi:protein ASI3 [Podospora australis]|uniref:Protein ASI3 n=1 Tax=Podospora australis TaxID=1536484 RepID=A0AAN6X4K5_9PEZI|nr:protein ASI3 [Podospora australis]